MQIPETNTVECIANERISFSCDSEEIESFTEFTAQVFSSFVTGWVPVTDTTQAPQPPSKHMNFVPLSSAFVRMKVFKLVSIGTVDEVTENNEIPVRFRFYEIEKEPRKIRLKVNEDKTKTRRHVRLRNMVTRTETGISFERC